MNPEFIIRIIVRARNEIAGTLNRASAEVEKLTKAQERGAKTDTQRAATTKKYAAAVDDASKRYDKFTKSIETGSQRADVAERHLRSFRREFERLGNRVKPGTQAADQLYQLSKNAETLGKQISEATKQQEREAAAARKMAEDVKASQASIRAELAKTVRARQAARTAAERDAADERIHDQAETLRARGMAEQEIRRVMTDATKSISTPAEKPTDRQRRISQIASEERAKRSITVAEAQRTEREVTLAIEKELRGRMGARTTADRAERDARISGYTQELRDIGVHESQIRRILRTSYTQLSQDASKAGFGSTSGGTRRQTRIQELVIRQRVRRENIPDTGRGNVLTRFLGIDTSKFDDIDKKIHDFDTRATRANFSVVRLAGNLRGLIIIGVVGFFSQLTSILIAVGATLVSVASSAAQAGAALGGIAVAGIAQALPVIGLFAAAWGRVGAVFQLLKQQQLEQIQATHNQQQALDQQRAAAEAVQNAQEGLAQAHRNVAAAARGVTDAEQTLTDAQQRVGEAQKTLTQARKDAVRQIEDLLAAEKQAELQAERSALAQSAAQDAFRSAITSGNVGDLAQRALDIRSTGLDAQTSQRDLQRARTDARAAQQGGVAGQSNVQSAIQQLHQARQAVQQARQGVLDANQSVDDANRGVAKAAQGLADAKHQQSEALSAQAAVQRKFDALLKQLSPAERQLYEALKRIRDRYHKTFTGQGGVIESITTAFVYGANKIYRLMNDPRILNAGHRLADTIGGQIRRIFDFASSGRNVNFFLDMAQQARRNLPIMVTIGEHVITILENVARAASPALHAFLEFISNLTGNWARTSGTESGMARMTHFFKVGEQYLQDWMGLLISIARLFGAIIGTSAQQGTNVVIDLTTQVNKATDYINAHHKAVVDFFREARLATYQVATAIWDIAKALIAIYRPERISELTHALEQTLLPALVLIFNVLGSVTGILLKLAGMPGLSVLAEWAVAGGLLFKSLSPFVGLISKLLIGFGRLTGSLELVDAGLIGLRVATGPVGVAIAFVATALAILHGRVHSVTDVLKALGITLSLILGYLTLTRGFVGTIVTVVRGLEGLGATAGRLGRLGGALERIAAALASMLKLIPGVAGAVSKIGGGAAAVAAPVARMIGWGSAGAATATGAAGAGAAVGAAEGATALRVIGMGFLRKAGWIGLGITAATSILSGFKHHSVTAGFQDFFHSLTFGLVKSADESAREAVKRINNRLARGVTQLNLTPDTRPRPGARFAGYGGPQPSQDATDLSKLTPAQRAAVTAVMRFRTELNKLRREHAGTDLFAELAKRVEDFARNAPPELHTAVSKLVTDVETQFSQTFKIKIDYSDLKAGADSAKNLADAFQSMQDDIDGARKGVKRSLNGIKTDTILSTRIIKLNTVEGSATARDALAHNFMLAAAAVREHMREAGRWTKDGIATMDKYMREALAQYGITGRQARSYIRDARKGGQTGFHAGDPGGGGATGGRAERIAGWIGRQGERGRDAYRVVLGRGEAVLNWAHQKVVEPALHAAYGFGLDGLFRKVRGKHGAEISGGMAGGGRPGAGSLFDGHPSNVIPGIRSLIRLLKGKFPLIVTSTTDHVARTSTGGLSDHPSGHAVDLSGADSVMTAAVNFIKGSGLFRQLKQGIHDPGLAVNLGRFVSGPGFFAQAWEQHKNHIHLALAGALRGALGDLVDRIRAPRVPGSSTLSQIAQGMLVGVARAATRRLRELTAPQLDASQSRIPAFRGPWVQVMQSIARMRHWNLGDWRQLVSGESGGVVSRVNQSSGAFGLGQFLGATARAYARFGALSHDGADQIRAMAQYISDRYKTPTAALRAWLSRSPHWYEQGGSVPGRGPVGAVLHGGEHVWTAAEVARAGGHHVIRLMRKLLGGGGQGGPMGYDVGGAIAAAARARGYTPPNIMPTDAEGILGELNKAAAVIHRLRTRVINKRFTDALSRSFSALVGDGGLFDQLSDAIDALTTRLDTQLKRGTYRVTKTGIVLQRLNPVALAEATERNLRTVYSALSGELHDLDHALADVTRRLRARGISAAQRQELRTVQNNLRKRIDAVRGQIADNIEAQYNAIEDQISTQVDAANTSAGLKTGFLDVVQRIRAVIGGTALGAAGAPSNEALGNVRARALNTQADALQKAADLARRQGHNDTADQILAQIQDLRQTAIEAVQQGLSDDVDEINRQATRATTSDDIRSRIATALGRVDDLAGIAADKIGAMNTQIAALRQKQQDAAAHGFTNLAETIGDQIADLQAGVIEASAQALNDAKDRIDQAAQRQSSLADIGDRVAALREKAGDFAGAYAQRATDIQQRGAALNAQIGGLMDLRNQAAAQGNTGLVQSLNDELADLNVQVQENTQALADNTVAARQSKIDQILARGSFLTTLFSNLNNIVGALGAITGVTDTGTQKGLLSNIGTVLAQTGSGLIQQLLQDFGVDLSGLDPKGIVNALSSLNFDQIEANFTPDQKKQFEDLINSIIDNTGSQLSNTQALNEITGAQNQSWNSTSWQWLRNAIFNGSGGLLTSPYIVPSAVPSYVGGVATMGTSPAVAAAGSANASAAAAGAPVFAPSITNEERVVDMDPDTLANRLWFRYRDSPSA